MRGEVRHSHWTIAVVVAGTFQYRSAGRALLTPGSMLLGTHGQCCDCDHEHREGDRCVSFWYAPEFFERLVADAAGRADPARFAVERLPPLRARLRHAALRLIDEPTRVLDIALETGFGDVSNFNRAFRAEFGVSPRTYRHFRP